MKTGMESVGGLLSPTLKAPVTIDLRGDDSDEEDAEQETATKKAANNSPSAKAAGATEDDAELTVYHIDDLSYRAAQKECKKRDLLAVGSGDILKDRLRQALQQSGTSSLPSASPGMEDDRKKPADECIAAKPTPSAPAAVSAVAPDTAVATAEPAPIAQPAADRAAAAAKSPPKAAAKSPAKAPAKAPGNAPEVAKATSSQGGGMFSALKTGAEQVMKALSSPSANEPETIDLMDASDDEVEVTKVVKSPAAAIKQEDVADIPADTKADDASMLTAKDVDDMSFHELRSECKRRNLGGNGKKGDLQEKLKAAIPTSIGDTTVPPSPMSSIASTPDNNSARSRSRTTPRSGLSTGGSRSRRGKAEARSKFDAALGLPAVKEEEEEEGAATSVMATPAQRPGRRRKKADDDEDQSIADESASKPTPAKRQKRTKTAATPASGGALPGPRGPHGARRNPPDQVGTCREVVLQARGILEISDKIKDGGKAEARSKFDAALGLPAVKEEEEEEDKGGGANEKPSAAAAAVAVAAAEPAPTARATAAPAPAPAPAKPTAAKATSSQSEGMFSLLKKGAMQFMSPAKEPETIDLMDA
eukprot:CAMPEP_0185826380 /NCGR_PEP_ID=MMETSP1322-20130828/31518_1 /TAXON_ID=265543 /ORGANISM="Minutocellus polymorphus, Strain RCC2270" /LENGTH=590 /DNA_ID=CAMNT_0028524107 /DNA_START=76 /DNA_END=1845 /DNA_ORIENTATION=+